MIFYAKYPVKIPKPENDDYNLMCDKNASKFYKNKLSKYIYKYTKNEQEFSVVNIPFLWKELHSKMIELVENRLNSATSLNSIEKKAEIIVKLAEAMPLSCLSTHLHKFDNIELNSEPKVIFLENIWYK